MRFFDRFRLPGEWFRRDGRGGFIGTKGTHIERGFGGEWFSWNEGFGEIWPIALIFLAGLPFLSLVVGAFFGHVGAALVPGALIVGGSFVLGAVLKGMFGLHHAGTAWGCTFACYGLIRMLDMAWNLGYTEDIRFGGLFVTLFLLALWCFVPISLSDEDYLASQLIAAGYWAGGGALAILVATSKDAELLRMGMIALVGIAATITATELVILVIRRILKR